MGNRFTSRITLILATTFALLLTACGAGGYGGAPSAPQEAGAGPVGDYPAQEEDAGEDGRMVIRTKTLRLEVENTADAVTEVRDLTRSHSGTVTDMQVATEADEYIYRNDEGGGRSALRGWLTVRVPTDGYEAFVEEVGGIGTIKYQSEASTDVTQEHVDLSARLENLRAQEERLREFFDQATDVEDMLAIEAELGRVRGEIESMDAQVKHLERQAAMATITVELVEPRSVVSPGGSSWGFGEAFTDGIRGAADFLTGLITFIIATSPLWLLVGILWFPVRAFMRRRRAANSGAPRPAPRTVVAPPPAGARPAPKSAPEPGKPASSATPTKEQ